jgi:hypothetical protein
VLPLLVSRWLLGRASAGIVAHSSIVQLAVDPLGELVGAPRCLSGNSRGPDDGHDTAPDRHPRASHRLQACTTRECGRPAWS